MVMGFNDVHCDATQPTGINYESAGSKHAEAV